MMKQWIGIIGAVAVVATSACAAEAPRPARPKATVATTPGLGVREHFQRQRREARVLLDRQRKENEAMYKEIAALPLPQKIENLRAHRERQIGENEAFVRKQHRENIAFVKNSDAWPKERKAEIIANLHARHRTAEVFWTGLRKENRAFFTRLASHPEMAPERTTNAIRTFQQAQREKIQAWRKQNRPGIPLGDEPQRRRKRPGAKSDAPAEAKPRAKATL